MTMPPSTDGMHDVGYFSPVRLGRDYGFLIPGFFLSLVAFVLLVPLTAVSVGTFIVWMGALLLPATLLVATGFARISRARLAWWRGPQQPGEALTGATAYRSRKRGLTGWFTLMADPRRWLDLLYETLIAFPLHIATFAVSVAWGLSAIGGITFPAWGVFLPRGADEISLGGLILEAATNGVAPDSLTHSFLLDLLSNLVTGVVFLVTLPAVVHGLARLDGLVMSAALGEARRTDPTAPIRRDEDAAPASEAVAASPFRSPSREGWAWIAAAFTAAAGLAVGWPLLAVGYHAGVVAGMLLALGQGCAVLLAVRWRGPAIALDTVVVVATVLLAPGAWGWPWPWPVVTLLVHVSFVLLVAVRGRWGTAVAAWALPAVGAVVTALLVLWTGTTPTGTTPTGNAGDVAAATMAGLPPGVLANLIVATSVSAASTAIGIILRALIAGRDELRDQRAAARTAGAERAELAERNRIARELHDVVAHSMSVISVQATTAPYRLDGLDDAAKQEFAAIADSSRTALSEMRGLLAVLRADGSAAPTTPQPMLSDLADLVEATRASGTKITIHQDEPELLRQLPAAVSLTAYRIVQEGLSNAVRHSPGAAIDVVLRFADAEVDGEAATGRRGTRQFLHLDVANGPVPPHEGEVPRAAGAGLGLKGIRERAQALGGTVETEELSGGGFDLRARLPL